MSDPISDATERRFQSTLGHMRLARAAALNRVGEPAGALSHLRDNGLIAERAPIAPFALIESASALMQMRDLAGAERDLGLARLAARETLKSSMDHVAFESSYAVAEANLAFWRLDDVRLRGLVERACRRLEDAVGLQAQRDELTMLCESFAAIVGFASYVSTKFNDYDVAQEMLACFEARSNHLGYTVSAHRQSRFDWTRSIILTERPATFLRGWQAIVNALRHSVEAERPQTTSYILSTMSEAAALVHDTHAELSLANLSLSLVPAGTASTNQYYHTYYHRAREALAEHDVGTALHFFDLAITSAAAFSAFEAAGMLLVKADVLVEEGDAVRALREVLRVEALIDGDAPSYLLAELRRVRGAVRFALGDARAAAQDVRLALELFEHGGDTVSSQKAYELAYEIFGLSAYQERARELRFPKLTLDLNDLDVLFPAIVSDGAVMLTPRQREVARLVSAGLSDESIASRLDRSPKTIANTVSSLLRSLRVSTRAEITRKRIAGQVASDGVITSP